MLLLVGIAAGIVAGWLLRGSLRALASARLAHETIFLTSLVIYLIWPAAAPVLGTGHREYVVVWILVAVLLAGVALVNSSYPGMILAAAGLLLNVLVIAANGAMPVAIHGSAGGQAAQVGAIVTSPLHEPMHEDTALPILGDVIYVGGPGWLRAMVSAGDLFLAAGAGVVVAHMMRSGRRTRDGAVVV